MNIRILSLLVCWLWLFLAIISCTKSENPNTDTTNFSNVDTVGAQFIVYSIGGNTYAMLPPKDTILAVHIKGQNDTHINSYTQATASTFNFSLSGSESIGSKPITYFHLRQENRPYIVIGSINASISHFSSVRNGYITGNFSGTVRDTISSQTFPISCSFKVQRDN